MKLQKFRVELPSRHTLAWYGLTLLFALMLTLRNPLRLSERTSVGPSACANANASAAVNGGGRAAEAGAPGVLWPWRREAPPPRLWRSRRG